MLGSSVPLQLYQQHHAHAGSEVVRSVDISKLQAISVAYTAKRSTGAPMAHTSKDKAAF